MKKYQLTALLLVILSLCIAVAGGFAGALSGMELLAYAGCYLMIYIFGSLLLLVWLRKLMSDIEVARRSTLLCWELPPQKRNLLPLMRIPALFLALIIAAGAILLIWVQTNPLLTVSFLVSLLAFAVGCYTFAAGRRLDVFGRTTFRLCHNALFLNGSKLALDGCKCAVYDVTLNDKLHLGIVCNGSQSAVDIPVPSDQRQAASDFIDDLTKHFNEEKNDNA